jgi:hypothetical protein
MTSSFFYDCRAYKVSTCKYYEECKRRCATAQSAEKPVCEIFCNLHNFNRNTYVSNHERTSDFFQRTFYSEVFIL